MATIFALGAMSAAAVKAWETLKADGIEVEVVGVSCPFALDAGEIKEGAARGPVFVVEDHLSVSGLASQIAYLASTNGLAVDLVPMGIRGFPPSGPSDVCLKCFELHPEDLARRMKRRLKEKA